MSKRLDSFKKFLTFSALLTVTSSCGIIDEIFNGPSPFEPMTILTPKAANSVVVCRTQQCAPARTNMTREFLYNSLLNLFDNNLGSTVLLCDADPNSRMCFENYIKFTIKAGVTPATVVIDSAKILDVRLKKKEQTIEIALDYNTHYNSVRPICRTSKNALFVKTPDYVLMEDTGYRCKFTTISTSLISTVYSIDYVDLDYGVIGMNYSFGVSGPAYGGGTGYMLMRFQKNAYPSDPKKFTLPKAQPEAPAPKATLDAQGNKVIEEYGVKTDAAQIAPGQYKVAPLPLK